MGYKFIECAKCGRLIHIDEVAEHSKWHSENSEPPVVKPTPKPTIVDPPKCGRLIHIDEDAEHSKWHFENPEPPEPPVVKSTPKPIIVDPPISLPKPRGSSKFGLIVFAIILICIGLILLFGYIKYWPLILVVVGIIVLIRMIISAYTNND